MSIIEIIRDTSPWYLVATIAITVFHAGRALMEQMRTYAQIEAQRSRKPEAERELPYSKVFRVVYSYIQEILFKTVISLSGFISLLIAYHIFSSAECFNEVGAGTVILLIFLFIWGVIGISGYLTYLIVSGKLQFLKIG